LEYELLGNNVSYTVSKSASNYKTMNALGMAEVEFYKEATKKGVYQHKGFIDVVSQPCQGTVFTTFLPRETSAASTAKQIIQTPPQSCTETILLVEDDEMVLELASIMLEKSGYKVLATQTAELAITLAREHTDRINLLLTDVIMPNMNGKDIAFELKTICPDMKVLFMSGYTADIIATQGVIADNTHFLQKTFTIRVLTAKVRSVLDEI
jgi:CheY-like chemotaxis protein